MQQMHKSFQNADLFILHAIHSVGLKFLSSTIDFFPETVHSAISKYIQVYVHFSLL